MQERKIMYEKRVVELTPFDREILVHRMMNYKCDVCGRIFEFWLEKGLEDRKQDEINPEQHKPVPFCTACLCGGTLQHSFWGSDVCLDDYRPLQDGENFFENTDEEQCGTSHIRNLGIVKYGNTGTRLSELDEIRQMCARQMFEAEEKEEFKKQDVEDFEADPYGLGHISTTTLKKELRRRKRY